jgi:diadenosine tetraphosphate (Ap4A) HIT family hydrolase
LIAELFFVAKKVAYDLNIQEGYQLKFHVWALWGQEIMHLHLHLLSDI